MPERTRLTVATGLATEAGRRDENQDFAALCEPSGTLRDLRGLVSVVADGVSEGSGGRVAAQVSVRTFLDGYYESPEPLDVVQAANRSLTACNSWIHSQGRVGGPLEGMSTTLSALILRQAEAWTVHVGDTRIYQLRQDLLTRMTTDHAMTHPDMKHVLVRAIGFEPFVRIDMARYAVRVHDRFLLCSDGVHGSLDDATIRDILAERRDPQSTADHVVERALRDGSRDNATALVVDVLGLPPPEQQGLELAAARLPIADLPAAGDTIDGFRLDRQISDGRYSRLFAGVDTLGDVGGSRQLALKFPHPRVTGDETYRSAFVRESWVASRVHSPFVAEVLEVPADRQTRLYTVMPLYEGETIEARLLRRPAIGLEEGIAIALQLAKGVHALHRRQIIHRDIKTENVLLHGDGVQKDVKLVDLGVALLAGFPDFMPEDVPGTASYMAPELFTGFHGDERSDVFALGVTLYRMFSGGRYPYGEIEPFSSPRHGRPVPLARYRPDLPAWLDEVIGRAIAVSVDERFGDTMELAFELENGLARGAPVVKRFVPLIESNPLRFWQGLCLVLGLALVALLAHRTQP